MSVEEARRGGPIDALPDQCRGGVRQDGRRCQTHGEADPLRRDLRRCDREADDKWGTECPATPPLAALDSFLTQCSNNATQATGGTALPPFCGDGSVNACGEECDGSALGGATCASEGFPGGGSLSCTAACGLDTSACQATIPTRCCQISATGLSACTDVVASVDCATANAQLALFGASATLTAEGNVCDGASGLCAAQRSGVGTCCQISSSSFSTCAEGNDPGGATCNAIESVGLGFQTTPFIGYRCVGTGTIFGNTYTCTP